MEIDKVKYPRTIIKRDKGFLYNYYTPKRSIEEDSSGGKIIGDIIEGVILGITLVLLIYLLLTPSPDKGIYSTKEVKHQEK